MDGAVNSGVGRSPKWIQVAVDIEPDGKVGPMTLTAVKKADPVEIIDKALDARLVFLQRQKHWPVFGKGWSRRVESVREVAKKMAEEGKKGGSWRLPFFTS